MFGGAAKRENAELKNRIARLEQLLANLGGEGIAAMQNYQIQLSQELTQLEQNHQRATQKFEQMQAIASTKLEKLQTKMEQLDAEIIDARDTLRLQGFGWFEFENPAEASVQLEQALKNTRDQARKLVSNKKAVTTATSFTFNNSAYKGRRFMNRMSKLALRSYNAEVENAIVKLKAGSLETAQKRLVKAKEQVERMGNMIDLRISDEYHALRMEELHLAAQHLEAKKAAKEAEREERARLREEKKAQAELEAERKRLEKEKSHYENAIAKLRESGRDDEIADLENKLVEINKGIDNVDYRHGNIRAGYVYVISNIGSFGERMVKIGMTRRLDPMDRVRELGDASVPFNFDVHALHFSDDAVGIETALHQRFAQAKVNRINNRREFFYVTPAEVKQALLEIGGNVLEYRDDAEAEQFRLSQAIIADEKNAAEAAHRDAVDHK